MKRCASCRTTILFGGTSEGDLRFCSDRCRVDGRVVLQARELPPELVQRALSELAQGACPVCKGPGPVDVFTSHRVLSLIAVTRWKSMPRVSCRACATKSQLGSTFYSLFLGWWGFPWGLVMTPIQIARNLAGLARNADSSRPSEQLERIVRVHLASEQAAASRDERPAVQRAA